MDSCPSACMSRMLNSVLETGPSTSYSISEWCYLNFFCTSFKKGSLLEIRSNLYLAATYWAVTLWIKRSVVKNPEFFPVRYFNFHLYLVVNLIRRSWSPLTKRISTFDIWYSHLISHLIFSCPWLSPNGLFVLPSTCIERSLRADPLRKTKNNLSSKIYPMVISRNQY